MYIYIKKVENTTTSHILIFPRALSVIKHLQEKNNNKKKKRSKIKGTDRPASQPGLSDEEHNRSSR